MSFKPESEVFEITDFTNVTEWEAFTHRLEKILHSLGVANTEAVEDSAVSGAPDVQVQCATHEVALRAYKFAVSLLNVEAPGEAAHADVQSALYDSSDDFPPRSHCLTRWFGLRTFVILSPAGDPPFSLTDLSLATQLLSSLSVAAGQTKCILPLFVQVQRSERRMYDGVWLSGNGLRTDFSVLDLPRIPVQYNHLSGLIDIFKAELGVVAPPPADISIRFTYLLNSWPASGLYCPAANLSALAVGGSSETIKSMQLSVTWPSVREDAVVDNALYSDLDPVVAPSWDVRVLFRDSDSSGHALQFKLSNTLRALLDLCQRGEKVNELLGRHAFQEDEPSAELQENVRQALTRMTAPAMRAPTLSSLVRSAVTSSALEDSPLESEILDQIVRDVFPDFTDGYVHSSDTGTVDAGEGTGSARFFFKTCPADSVLVRMACVLVRVFCEHGGIRPLAYVWREFVLELRHRYDNTILILDVPRACVPDMRYGLLQQKLQMLQCCTEHKLKRKLREGQMRAGSPSLSRVTPDVRSAANCPTSCQTLAQDEDSTDDEYDEFQDAVEELEVSLESSHPGDSGTSADPATEADTSMGVLKAEGIQEVSSHLCLIATGEHLNIPVTQDVTPMTEDTLAQHQDMLAGFGTSDTARRLRARLQSAQLLADMEAFKAANPGCLLGDFVRWHSPRDWVESTGCSSSSDTEDASALHEEPDGAGGGVDGKKSQEGWDHGDWDVVADGVASAAVVGDSVGDIAGLVTEDHESQETQEPGGDVPVAITSDADDPGNDLTAMESVHEDGATTADCSPSLPQHAVKGQLSVRMRDPSTLWHQIWISAQPVPAHRQHRLFNDTFEAERVFQFLEKLTVGELMLHLAPVILEHGLKLVGSLPEARFEDVASLLESSSVNLARVFQTSVEFLPQLSDAVLKLSEAEEAAVRIHSLLAALRFGTCQHHGDSEGQSSADQQQLDDWLAVLAGSNSLELDGAAEHPLGQSVRGLAMVQVRQQQQQQQDSGHSPETISLRREAVRITRFPPPAAREFIIRHTLPRPSSHSRPTVQRMFAVLTAKEFHLATALSSDMTYM